MILDELIIDRTQADLEGDSDKGYYNALDMNRVGAAITYILERLASYSISTAIVPRQDYMVGEILSPAQLQAYLDTVRALRNTIGAMDYTLPSTMNRLGFEEANEIERFMLYLDALISRMAAIFPRSDNMLYSGSAIYMITEVIP